MAKSWDDFTEENDGLSEEEQRELERREAEEEERVDNHPLSLQAAEIMDMIDVLLDTASDDDSRNMFGSTLRESATIIMAKLASGLRSDSYLICMQKAAIIRDHAEYLRLSNHMLSNLNTFDPKYIRAFREEMEKFRMLFIDWVAEIREMDDDIEDEWGLFKK